MVGTNLIAYDSLSCRKDVESQFWNLVDTANGVQVHRAAMGTAAAVGSH
jgi:hypothetical protein